MSSFANTKATPRMCSSSISSTKKASENAFSSAGSVGPYWMRAVVVFGGGVCGTRYAARCSVTTNKTRVARIKLQYSFLLLTIMSASLWRISG